MARFVHVCLLMPGARWVRLPRTGSAWFVVFLSMMAALGDAGAQRRWHSQIQKANLPRYILSDVDGTLLKSNGQGKGLGTQAMQKTARLLLGAPEGVKAHGGTDLENVTDLYLRYKKRRPSGNEVSHFFKRYEKELRTLMTHANQLTVLPGVHAFLEFFLGQGAKLMVVTGNTEANAWAKLKRAGLDRYFADGAFGDQARNRNHLVELALRKIIAKQGLVSPRNVMMVGDTPADVTSAHANGVLSLAVGTGKSTTEELGRFYPSYNFSGLQEATEMFRSIANKPILTHIPIAQ